MNVKSQIQEALKEHENEKSKGLGKYKLMVDYLKGKYEFFYNEVSTRVLYKEKSEKILRNWDDRSHSTLFIELVENGIMAKKDLYVDFIKSAYLSKPINPVKDYLLSLPGIDESRDYISEYASQIVLMDESKRDYLNHAFKKWFVAMVASMRKKSVNHTCLVLFGEQGIYKTTFINSLVPECLQEEYLYIGNYNPNDKDYELMLGSKLLINLDEMATLNKIEIEAIKTKITQPQITLRKAYGRENIILQRLASFAGSTNKKEFLTDLTGNRRFLTIACKDIRMKSLNIDNCYSQAINLILEGYEYWMGQSEIAWVEQENQEFLVTSIEQDMIMTFFQIPDDHCQTPSYMTATDISLFLNSKNNRVAMTAISSMKIGQIMKKLGFRQKKVRINKAISPTSVWVVDRTYRCEVQDHETGQILKSESEFGQDKKDETQGKFL